MNQAAHYAHKLLYKHARNVKTITVATILKKQTVFNDECCK